MSDVMWPNSDTVRYVFLNNEVTYSSQSGGKGLKKLWERTRKPDIITSKPLLCVPPITPLPVLLKRLPGLLKTK